MKKICFILFSAFILFKNIAIAKPIKSDAEENNIQIFFLSPLTQKVPKNECKNAACKALLKNINEAQESIDFAIYGINEQDKIFNALVKAQKRGIKIRWVTDLNEKNRNIYYDTYALMHKIPTYNTDYDSIESKIIPNYKYKLDYQGALMHNKFFIFDNKKVFTGSTNISSYCLTGYNSNVSIMIDSPLIAEVYKQEFEQMYSGKFHNEKSAILNNENIKIGDSIVSIYFSPINKPVSEKILPLIKVAKNYIYIPAFYLTRKSIIYELVEAQKRGVDVKIIVDESSVEGKYVDIDFMKNNGLNVKVENWGGKMHMKSMIIDDETLIVGSMNFTKQGERMNDENCLIIKSSPKLTRGYKEHFLVLWNSIK